jgi:hypothetical protein
VGRSKQEILDWEKRRAVPAALLTFLTIATLIASAIALTAIKGDGSAEILRSTDQHRSAQLLSGIFQGLGFALMAVPLFYLFRAAQGRSDRVRNQLVGLVVVAPLFLGISTVLGAAAKTDGAKEFVAGNAKATLSVKEATQDCVSQRKDEGAKDFADEFEPKAGESALAACRAQKIADDAASNAVSEASLSGAAAGFGLAGALGLVIAFFYTGLWGMRTGLLGRFWGSFGMAVGVAVLIGFIPLVLIWLVYVGLLFGGWLPGGRPPAWEAGEAVPWPTPGEKAAAELEPEGAGPHVSPELEIGDTQSDGSDAPRRKRKRRE